MKQHDIDRIRVLISQINDAKVASRQNENTCMDYLEALIFLPVLFLGYFYEKCSKWFYVGRKCGEL